MDDFQGRTASFQSGINGGDSFASSLDAASARFNDQVGGFSPASVLDAYQLPGFHPANGNSAGDIKRQTPAGPLPTLNGTSQSTYDALTPTYGTRLAP